MADGIRIDIKDSAASTGHIIQGTDNRIEGAAVQSESRLAQGDKAQIDRLVVALLEALRAEPGIPEPTKDKIAEHAQAAQEAAAAPSRGSIFNVTVQGLKDAAEGIKAVAPTAFMIAQQLVQLLTR
jgi:hypothetical protein